MAAVGEKATRSSGMFPAGAVAQAVGTRSVLSTTLPRIFSHVSVPLRRLLIVVASDAGSTLTRVASTQHIEIAQVVNVSHVRGIQDLTAALEPGALEQAKIWGILIAAEAAVSVPANLLLLSRLAGVLVFGEAGFWEEEAGWIDIDSRDPSWFLGANGFRAGWPTAAVGRVLDLVTATALLALTLPVMLIVSLWIKLDSPGPIFYRQERVGLGGKVFMLNKFRSMLCDAEAEGRPRWAQIGDTRITRVGKFIRHARIDELPQLLNVLRGEMSMVGPRPERPYFVEQLSAAIPFYAARHYVKPGITGWAQVNAPYGASIDDTREKLRYDLYYVKHRGFKLYAKILLQTVRVVLRGEGAR